MGKPTAGQKGRGRQRRGFGSVIIILILLVILVVLAYLALRGPGLLSGIPGSIIGGRESGNPLPTPRPGVDVGSGAHSAAKDTPEGTWGSYLSDIIAEQVARQEAKVNLFERYQDPDITAQNLGGMVQDIDLVEDNTAFNVGPLDTVANTQADFDIRITFTNGDTDTRTCRFPVSLQLNQEDGVWYVVNPDALAVFVVCG